MSPAKAGGGKGQTVNGEMMQLKLLFGTADNLSEEPTVLVSGRPLSDTDELPEPDNKRSVSSSALGMEAIAKESNPCAAFQEVARNGDSHGLDGRGIEDVRAKLESIVEEFLLL